MIYQNENFNGELDFRSAWHNGWLIDAHLHEFTELLYCHKGEGDVFVNGKHIRLTEKTMVWIPPNYIHQYDCPRALLICAVFSKDLIPLYFRATQEQRPIPTAVDACDVAHILELFPHLSKEEYVKVSGYLNLICAKVLDLSQYEPWHSISKGDFLYFLPLCTRDYSGTNRKEIWLQRKIPVAYTAQADRHSLYPASFLVPDRLRKKTAFGNGQQHFRYRVLLQIFCTQYI